MDDFYIKMKLLIYFIIFCAFFDSSTGYVNLAVNKTAWQTTNYSNSCCFATAAVDGSISRTSCALIKATTASGEWRVDLGEILSIHHVRIYYRNDSEVTTWRMAGFFLFVSNTTNKEDGHLCFHEIQTSLPPNPITMACVQHARYVIYYNERNGNGVNYPSNFSLSLWNELCEVEVFGCAKTGFYGEHCNKTCPSNCKNNYCEILNGHCLSCIDGYQGQACEQVCDNHFYGENCASGCGKCLNRQKCNHINGTCSNGCEVGWQGDKCFSECTPGTFGLGCNHTCSKNCNGNIKDLCHPETGNCNNGCLPGWQGEQCDKACDNFLYGENCSLPCGRCFGGEKCRHVNGICENGCVAGLHGDLCIKGCDPGKYGQGCNQSCNENCKGTHNTCELVTGECINGCKAGWKGRKCDVDANTVESESAVQPAEMSQSSNLLIATIVGWLIIGILIVSLIIVLILYNFRKSNPPKDSGQVYDDVEMDRRDDSRVYTSMN